MIDTLKYVAEINFSLVALKVNLLMFATKPLNLIK